VSQHRRITCFKQDTTLFVHCCMRCNKLPVRQQTWPNAKHLPLLLSAKLFDDPTTQRTNATRALLLLPPLLVVAPATGLLPAPAARIAAACGGAESAAAPAGLLGVLEVAVPLSSFGLCCGRSLIEPSPSCPFSFMPQDASKPCTTETRMDSSTLRVVSSRCTTFEGARHHSADDKTVLRCVAFSGRQRKASTQQPPSAQ
jgi:hypothetical protein